LTLSNRRHESMLAALQAQIAAAEASATAARMEAEAAKAAAEQAKQETMALSSLGLSVPTTPAAYDSDNRSIGGNSDMATPAERPPEVPKKDTPTGGGGGWFWSRRTESKAKIAVTPPAEG
jgi:hypothetical protein